MNINIKKNKKNKNKTNKNKTNKNKTNKNKRNKKYRKTRKLKFKKIKGGKIGDDSTGVRSNITVYLTKHEIRQRLREVDDYDFEVCGIYVIDRAGSNTLVSINESRGDPDSSRPYCVIPGKEDYTIIWHTHPKKSKFYPSIEDFLTTKKIRDNGERIQISILYTTLGMWIIKSLKDPQYPQDEAGYIEIIKEMNDDGPLQQTHDGAF